MIRKLALIHTVVFLADMFRNLIRENLPGLDSFHIVDESILQEALKEGSLTPGTIRRVAGQALLARDAGADMILFTCSSTSPAVDTVRSLLEVPVLKVDDPLAEKAVMTGERIGILVTARTTLEPSANLIRSWAEKRGKTVKVQPVLAEAAFQARLSGNVGEHDRIIREAVLRMAKENDVIVLAQASMAHLAEELDRNHSNISVLASPKLCMETLKRMAETEKRLI